MFETGDIIRHRSKFLRSIGWHTDVPVNGRVIDVRTGPDYRGAPVVLRVEWSDDTVSSILAANVEECPRARRAS